VCVTGIASAGQKPPPSFQGANAFEVSRASFISANLHDYRCYRKREPISGAWGTAHVRDDSGRGPDESLGVEASARSRGNPAPEYYGLLNPGRYFYTPAALDSTALISRRIRSDGTSPQGL
jgi:hypothetical protein